MATGKTGTKGVKKAAAPVRKKAGQKSADGNREYAFMLFLQKLPQGEISTRCGVSQQTITNWKQADNWEAKRASRNISIDTLMVTALQKINEMLESGNLNADAFSKAVAGLKSLKVRNTVDDEINCFLDFQNFLMERRHTDGVDEGFIKTLVKFQDAFVKHRLGNV